MRLTCPNCGAQYEVPDEVIPDEGRDVQCSNCGDTWYQAHPDFPGLAAEAEAELDNAPPQARSDAPPQAPSDPDPSPEPDTDTGNLRAALGGHDPDPDPDFEPAPPAHRAPDKKDVPEGIANILREEAEREAQLRGAIDADPLESQPDLGLDDLPDEPSQRAREARNRMARMRGQTPPDQKKASALGSRRDMLPDIEEINSSLRASDDGKSSHTAVGPARIARDKGKKGGFARGFALIVLIGVIMAAVYGNATRISAAVPQAKPVLDAYVLTINQARVWLDTQIGALVARPDVSDASDGSDG